jgi:hypothetical protein
MMNLKKKSELADDTTVQVKTLFLLSQLSMMNLKSMDSFTSYPGRRVVVERFCDSVSDVFETHS